jgi:hypothetical protein
MRGSIGMVLGCSAESPWRYLPLPIAALAPISVASARVVDLRGYDAASAARALQRCCGSQRAPNSSPRPGDGASRDGRGRASHARPSARSGGSRQSTARVEVLQRNVHRSRSSRLEHGERPLTRAAEAIVIPSRVIIEVLATFNEAVAHAVRAALARGVGSVTIDFTHAERVDPASLTRLARELAHGGGGTITLEGLPQDQERHLRYLGAHLPAQWTRGPVALA